MSEPKLSEKMSPTALEHAQRYIETNGAEGHMWQVKDAPKPMATLLLTTSGRITGQRYINPLLYGTSGRNFVIVASRGGAPVNPGWYKNLVANPEVDFQVGPKKYSGRARTASGAERAALWKLMTEVFPTYIQYQERAAARELPVIVLEPV